MALGMVVALGAATMSAEDAFARTPRLGSKTVNVADCPVDGAEGTHRCPATGGYAIVETRSEMSSFRLVVLEGGSFQIFLEPPACEEARHAGGVEWRIQDDVPFAVIQEVACYNRPAMVLSPDEEKKRKPVATHIVLKGLQGFESLSKVIAVRGGSAGARGQARQAADAFFKKQWPAIERQQQDEATDQPAGQ